jgi:hypothetical protein
MPDDGSVEDSGDSIHTEDSGQLCLMLSEAVAVGVEYPKSMRLKGQIQGHEMLILVDSGSSNTFLEIVLVIQLSGVSQFPLPLSVKVANGVPMECNLQFLDVVWEVHGLKFISDLKVLSLQHFDMILGYDWLAMFSPMKNH